MHQETVLSSVALAVLGAIAICAVFKAIPAESHDIVLSIASAIGGALALKGAQLAARAGSQPDPTPPPPPA